VEVESIIGMHDRKRLLGFFRFVGDADL
jgi:hypothetical protein